MIDYAKRIPGEQDDPLFQQSLYNFLLYNIESIPAPLSTHLFLALNEQRQEELKQTESLQFFTEQLANLLCILSTPEQLATLLQQNYSHDELTQLSTELTVSVQEPNAQSSTSEEEEEFEDVESSNET